MEGGTAHGYEIQRINCCVYGVPPAPVYKGARGRQPAKGRGAPKGGVLLPPGVGFPPPFQVVGVGVKERGKRREGRRGRSPSP